jgi:quercetin dioxygenase-like cupin family protein
MARWRLFVVVSALVGSVFPWTRVGAAADAARVEFEDAWVRVQSVSVNPGETLGGQNRSDGVLIYLTADLDGRMPRAEAAWQPASAQAVANRATTRFDALLVELKAPPSGAPPFVPELAPWNASHSVYVERGDHTVVSLIDNERVTVTRHRMAPLRWTERFHTHPREAVFVYLRGGELTGSSAVDGFHHARRGTFDVLPADFWHALYNGGNDPIEFVAVWPK